jgi:hypothetical protein
VKLPEETKFEQSPRGVVEVSPTLPGAEHHARSIAQSQASREFLIRSTRRVIDHYRRVLSIHRMTEVEQQAINARLAQQEELLRDLQGVDAKRSNVAHAYLEAS